MFREAIQESNMICMFFLAFLNFIQQNHGGTKPFKLSWRLVSFGCYFAAVAMATVSRSPPLPSAKDEGANPRPMEMEAPDDSQGIGWKDSQKWGTRSDSEWQK